MQNRIFVQQGLNPNAQPPPKLPLIATPPLKPLRVKVLCYPIGRVALIEPDRSNTDEPKV